MLAGLTGPDRRQRVPVVGGANQHGIDLRVFEHLTHVFISIRLIAFFLFDFGGASVEDIAVRIADGLEVNARQSHTVAGDGPAAAAGTDDSDIDAIIGAEGLKGGDCTGLFGACTGGQGSGRHDSGRDFAAIGKKLSAGQRMIRLTHC